ncbi:MAG TPA: hypothetical protein VJ846_02690 [Sphingomicrobium sp.]|nr:hypothetical protein [Sphingomicrobium sp.]
MNKGARLLVPIVAAAGGARGLAGGSAVGQSILAQKLGFDAAVHIGICTIFSCSSPRDVAILYR